MSDMSNLTGEQIRILQFLSTGSISETVADISDSLRRNYDAYSISALHAELYELSQMHLVRQVDKYSYTITPRGRVLLGDQVKLPEGTPVCTNCRGSGRAWDGAGSRTDCEACLGHGSATAQSLVSAYTTGFHEGIKALKKQNPSMSRHYLERLVLKVTDK